MMTTTAMATVLELMLQWRDKHSQVTTGFVVYHNSDKCRKMEEELRKHVQEVTLEKHGMIEGHENVQCEVRLVRQKRVDHTGMKCVQDSELYFEIRGKPPMGSKQGSQL